MPRLNKADRERVEALAEGMIAEASARESPRILSSNGFSRAHISILHQQLRCANLAWALKFTGRLKTGDVVGIVGGCFSGLMLASALAMCNDVVVYIFERERRLMQRFLDKSHRHISPNLNSRNLMGAFHPTYGIRLYEPPVFDWEADAASTIAVDWRNAFRGYAEKLPIFCFFNREVAARHIKASTRSVRLEFDPLEDGTKTRPIKLDWLIDATGFGPERNPFGLADHSYWESGHRLIYDYLGPKARVLISGCGDSGAIEAMHYAIKDFTHTSVDAFWPSAPHLDLIIDQRLEMAAFDDVTDWQDDWDLEELPLNSELRWFRGVCRYGAGGYVGGPEDLDAPRRRIFDAIETVLLGSGLANRLRKGDWQSYFDVLPETTAEVQTAVRNAASPILDEESSIAIRDAMEGIGLSKIFDMKALHRHARGDVEIVLNGETATPFTRNLSPFNVWLVYVVMSFPNVTYRRGRLSEVERQGDGHFQVRFEDGGFDSFNRVVTRYGAGGAPGLAAPRTATEPSGYLLVPPQVMVRKGDTGRYVDLARDEILRGHKRSVKRRTSKAAEHQIEKSFFAVAVEAPAKMWPKSRPREQYSQAALVKMLKEGVRPNFLLRARW